MLFVLNQRPLRHYKLYQQAASLSQYPDIWKRKDPERSCLGTSQLSFFNCCVSAFWNQSFSWKCICCGQIKICSSTIGLVVSHSWMNKLSTQKIRDWVQVSVSFSQRKFYCGNATAQATVPLLLQAVLICFLFSEISKELPNWKWTSAPYTCPPYGHHTSHRAVFSFTLSG